ncbi:MAG: hypothetical protein FWC47_03075 [Oscillospiraceae bacterium]|nr:hypothetical protein [Oscillospiraceae bacterium]
MFENFLNLVKNNNFEEIYLIGMFDEVDNEFVSSAKFIYFEFGSEFVELEAIEGYSKISIKIVDSIKPEIVSFDEIPCKSKIGNITFLDPLATSNKIKKISFYNLEKRENEVITDVLFIKLINDQEIFIDPRFFGFTIGGIEQKELWEGNLNYINWSIPKESSVEFD